MRLSALVLILALLAGCSSALPPQRGPALHAIQNQDLRGLMAEINGLLLSEKEMTEQQRDARRREYNQKIAETAATMDKAVDGIIAALPKLGLSQTEQATFLALADRLRGKSREVWKLASDNRSDGISAALEQMDATCKACHRLFRSDGG